MKGVYVHSTNSLMEILRSGKFLGSDKSSSKLGSGAPIKNPKTMFVEWGEGDIKASISRIKPARNCTRGILVFKDTNGRLDKSGLYPTLHGAEVPLSHLSLRAIIASEEDLDENDIRYSSHIEPSIKNFKGNTFGFFPEAFNSGEFKDSIDRILTEATLHGCFY